MESPDCRINEASNPLLLPDQEVVASRRRRVHNGAAVTPIIIEAHARGAHPLMIGNPFPMRLPHQGNLALPELALPLNLLLEVALAQQTLTLGKLLTLPCLQALLFFLQFILFAVEVLLKRGLLYLWLLESSQRLLLPLPVEGEVEESLSKLFTPLVDAQEPKDSRSRDDGNASYEKRASHDRVDCAEKLLIYHKDCVAGHVRLIYYLTHINIYRKMKNLHYVTGALIILALATEALGETSCTQELAEGTLGSHVAVESCGNIGVFSLGGRFKGSWETLTYFYPKPWSGTYLTASVDGTYYTTSDHPRNGKLTDAYLASSPTVSGKTITTVWQLPENIRLVQNLTVVENGTLIEVVLENKDASPHNLGVRLLLDTMVGVNDGAPIYVPGDGLKTTEKEYAGQSLNFKYWKAYNRQEDPTIVATGGLDPDEGLTYPVKVVIADWKQSKDAAWDYAVSQDKSILGDSAVILYYNIINVPAGGTYAIKTKFGSGVPVLPQEKGPFGITEVTQASVYGTYCPNDNVNISVDIVSSRADHAGAVLLEILDGGVVVYNETKPSGTVQQDSYRKLVFEWTIPKTDGLRDYTVSAVLSDESGNKVDSSVKPSFIHVNPKECPPIERKGAGWMLLGGLLTLILLALAVIAFLLMKREGEVLITKSVDEKGLVKVTVTNKKKRALESCVVSDGIPPRAEIKVSTLGAALREGKLLWNVGTLPAGQNATLEYRIKGVNVLPQARVSWDGGEKISN